MEISLLLSAAQTTPALAQQHLSFPDQLSSSTVSHPDAPRSADLPSHTNRYALQYASPDFGSPSTNSLSPRPFGNYNKSTIHDVILKKSSKPFRCTVEGCDATFGQKGSLTRHVKSRHEKLRPHSCDQCQKSFSALWTLRVHQRNVHLKSKPHKCHLCDKSFGELFNKSKHIAIVHEGKRPFSCPICSRAFGYKGDMRKHVLELHEQSGRPFQCMVPSCGVKFARKRYLRRHENLSHKGSISNVIDRAPSSVIPRYYADLRKEQANSLYLSEPREAKNSEAFTPPGGQRLLGISAQERLTLPGPDSQRLVGFGQGLRLH